MELGNVNLTSAEGDTEARLSAQNQIQQLLRNTNWKKKICIQENRICWCYREVFALEIVPVVNYTSEYVWVWGFLVFCVS